jgi:hypothetical protein
MSTVWEEEKVLMATGEHKLAKDVLEGDEVMSFHSGQIQPIKVVNCVTRLPDEVYRLITASGHSIITSRKIHVLPMIPNWVHPGVQEEVRATTLARVLGFLPRHQTNVCTFDTIEDADTTADDS